MQLESDGSRSGSSLSLRNIVGISGGNAVQPANASGQQTGNSNQGSGSSPSHRGVHRSISATNSSKTSRRASSGAETLREFRLSLLSVLSLPVFVFIFHAVVCYLLVCY